MRRGPGVLAWVLAALAVLVTVGLGGCTAERAEAPEQRHPDIESVQLNPAGGRVFDVVVTVSSPYDTPERYADGWRVLDPRGNQLGVHDLRHDHAEEQPFTRTQIGVEIPRGVAEVTVQGRDLEHGYGGATVTVPVPSPRPAG